MFFLIPIVLIAIGLPIFLIHPKSPQIFGDAVSHVKTHEKVVALTYDDGPNGQFTEDILALLQKHQIHATFFMVGEHAAQYPELIKKAYQAGHELGNHSWSHVLMVGKSSRFQREQIKKTDEVLRKAGYKGDINFRPPHGQSGIGLHRVLADMKKKNILFDVWGWDWSSPGTKKIVKYVMEDVRPGSIILLHDGCGTREQTVAASDIIIQRLKAQGYRFVTVSELLALRKKS